MANGRLVRIRYRQLPDDTLVQACATDHGSIVINIRPGMSVAARRKAIRIVLKTIQSNPETLKGPAGAIIPARPSQSVRDNPTDAG